MTTIYIKEQGAKVGRSGERLVVSQQGQVVDTFPMNQLDQLVLMGNVQLTTQAGATLMAREIDVVFMSIHGKFRYRLAPAAGGTNARLRLYQLRKLEDDAFSLQLARWIVDGKIHNQRAVLQRQSRATRFLAKRPFDKALAGMQRSRQDAQKAKNLDSLRGHEGKAAAFYFEAIRRTLDPEWKFKKRAYYPPPDPFNALLSFAYSLVLKDVEAAVNQVGLEPALGFFHEIHPGRPSLALDMMEEWRPYLADRMVLQLVNGNQLTPDDFTWTGQMNRPVELGEEGIRLVFNAYGARLAQTLYHPLAGPGGETTVRKAFVWQVRRLARVLAGKEAQYETVQLR